MRTPIISDGELLQLRDVVQAHSGIRVEAAKLAFLSDALGGLLHELGERSLFDLNLRLMREMASAGSAAWQALLPLVTINETYFFREIAQLELLRDVIAPRMRAARPAQPLRILSGPCSSGEEPFTVAMMLDDAPGMAVGPRPAIWGVDIDPVVVERARRGVYPRAAFRTTDGGYLMRHFRPEGGAWRVSDALAARVRFSRGNLLEPGGWPAGGRFDVILCRNMLIYFDRATQRKFAELAFHALTPGGVLMIGAAETLYGVIPGLDAVNHRGVVYYTKTAAAGRATA